MNVLVAALSTGLLSLAAWQDIRKHVVANWLTVPPLLAAMVWRVAWGDWQVGLLLVGILLIVEVLGRLGTPIVLGIGPVVLLAGWLAGASMTVEVKLTLVAWTCAWSAWAMHLMGGADAKVAMALIGFFPDARLALMLVAAQVSWSVYYLLRRYRRRALRAVLIGMLTRPTEDDLDARGVPLLPAYAAAGVAFVWWRVVAE